MTRRSLPWPGDGSTVSSAGSGRDPVTGAVHSGRDGDHLIHP